MDLNFQNVQRFCSEIDTAAERPLIDLSAVTWFEPYALIYLGMFLRYHNKRGKYFNMASPNNAKAVQYLTKQNFWGRFNFTPDPATDRSLLNLWSNTSFNDIIDLENTASQAEDMGIKLQSIIRARGINVDTEEVRVAVTELVQNFVEHAEEGLAVMMTQYYHTKHMLSIAVGDCGIGIRESLLKSGHPTIGDLAHKDAIVEAFQPKVTSKAEGGMGFDVVRSIAQDQHASLFLSSSDGCLYLDNHGKLYKEDVPYNLPGVQVELCFPERR